jgi:hypothetical protein
MASDPTRAMTDPQVPLSEEVLTDEQIGALTEVLSGITPLPWTTDVMSLHIRAGRGQIMVADDGWPDTETDASIVTRIRGFGSGQPQEKNLHAIAAVMNAAPKLLSTLTAERTARLQAEKERDAAREEAVHNGGEADGRLNALIRFTEDRLGMKLVGPCDDLDVFRLIEARVLGTEWKLDLARSQAEQRVNQIADLQSRLTAAEQERDALRKSEQAWRRTAGEYASAMHGLYVLVSDGATADEFTTPQEIEQTVTATISALKEELDAMQSRAEAAESDWQASEQTIRELRDGLAKFGGHARWQCEWWCCGQCDQLVTRNVFRHEHETSRKACTCGLTALLEKTKERT